MEREITAALALTEVHSFPRHNPMVGSTACNRLRESQSQVLFLLWLLQHSQYYLICYEQFTSIGNMR
jgi:hypothetical protein